MSSWKFFGGACILAAGLAIKFGAPLMAVGMGLALAGVLTWNRHRTVSKAGRRSI
jgi:hypothetical protein